MATALLAWLALPIVGALPAQGPGSRGAIACGPDAIAGLPLSPGAQVCFVEGRISGYDRVARTITANGTVVFVPPAVLLDVDDDEIGDLAFDVVFDPALEAQHTLVGGTLIADGQLVPLPTGCLRLEAQTVHVEFAENVVVGPITFVDPGGMFFEVAGASVRMNTDRRFPHALLDLGANEISIQSLAGFEGTLAEVNGYFEGGALRATHVETLAWTGNPFTDTVFIERVTWDPSKESLEVRGFVSPDPHGAGLATNVQIFSGSGSPGTTTCAGAFVANQAVTPELATVLGQFRYRSPDHAFPLMPASVCVHSPYGGVAERALP